MTICLWVDWTCDAEEMNDEDYESEEGELSVDEEGDDSRLVGKGVGSHDINEDEDDAPLVVAATPEKSEKKKKAEKDAEKTPGRELSGRTIECKMGSLRLGKQLVNLYGE
jgi:hypothetical protein